MGPPLAGIKVVEIATIIAAPLGASFLADMGAEVIKVEQIGGDPYRGLGAGVGAARVNAGKQSLSVDLKAAAGRAMVLDLIAEADVLIHNFRPGVPERLGIGYEQVRDRNPRLVYLQSNGYGPDGPGAERPSTHPIPGAAMGGVLYQLGERVPDAVQDMDGLRLWTRRLMRANEVNPDPNTALVVTTSAMLGLAARHRTGQGQRVLVDMFGANAYANHDDFLAYPGKAARALPDPLLYGLSASYRLYRCARDQWVFLALTSEREFQRFSAELMEAGLMAPGAGPRGRVA
jgi:crotonobetainyl-CoA:carnitine CoA-transferase CaiB-like acyl-CoA transferase